MFESALGSVLGVSNSLQLKTVKRASVILVDGLGSHNLRAKAGHAPFLSSELKTSGSIATGFPTTTASSIASFGTGLQPGEHGLVGYSVFDTQYRRFANLLSGWGPDQDPLEWQRSQTVAERAVESGVDAFVIGPSSYAESGFTKATMRGATYLPANSIEERFAILAKLHAKKSKFLTYCYVPELDQAAHSVGWDSAKWVMLLELLDSQMRRFQTELESTDGAILTADHGVIDVTPDNHVYLDELDIQWPSDAVLAGDPRVTFIYCQADQVQALATQLSTELGEGVLTLTREQVIEAGWYGEQVTDLATRVMPQLFLVPLSPLALYHRGFSTPQSMKMVGQHGSMTNEELLVPFIRLGGYR